jgi:hypothetical protein
MHPATRPIPRRTPPPNVARPRRRHDEAVTLAIVGSQPRALHSLEHDVGNAASHRTRWNPSSSPGYETVCCFSDRICARQSCERRRQCLLGGRSLHPIECSAFNAPIAVKRDHAEVDPDDASWSTMLEFNESFSHPCSSAGEPRQTVVRRIPEHLVVFCERQAI